MFADERHGRLRPWAEKGFPRLQPNSRNSVREQTDMAAQLALTAWALGLAYEDWRWRRLPNTLLLAGIILGLAHWAAYGAMPLGVSLLEGSVAAAVGLLALLPFYRAGWMGAGDVKFCAVIGLLAGLRILLGVFLIGSIVAGVFALFMLIPGSQQFASGPELEVRLRNRIPFGVGLSAALIALATGWIDPAIFHFW